MPSSPVLIRATRDRYGWRTEPLCWSSLRSEWILDLHTGLAPWGPVCLLPPAKNNLLPTSEWGQVWGGCQHHPAQASAYQAQWGSPRTWVL